MNAAPQSLHAPQGKALITRKSGVRALIYAVLSLLLAGISSFGMGAVQVHSGYRTVAEALTHAQGLAYVPFIACGLLSLVALILTLIYGIRGTLTLRSEGQSLWGWICVALLILSSLTIIFVVLPLCFGLIIALAVGISL